MTHHQQNIDLVVISELLEHLYLLFHSSNVFIRGALSDMKSDCFPTGTASFRHI